MNIELYAGNINWLKLILVQLISSPPAPKNDFKITNLDLSSVMLAMIYPNWVCYNIAT